MQQRNCFTKKYLKLLTDELLTDLLPNVQENLLFRDKKYNSA